MTTRLYLTNTTTGYTPTTKRGAWDDSAATLIRRLAPQPLGTATTTAVAVGSLTANWDVLQGRWVSDAAIAAGTISGNVNWIAGIRESAAGLNAFYHVHIYVTTGNTDTPRGTLLTDNIGATEHTTTGTGRGEGNKALTSVAIQVGDRIVVEIGYRATAGATGQTSTLDYGNIGQVDLTQGSTSVTTQPGYFEFDSIDGLFHPQIVTLLDQFTSLNTTIWNGNYGTVNVTGGRVEIACSQSGGVAIFSGLQSSPLTTTNVNTWHLADSQIHCEAVTMPAAAGGTGVYALFIVFTDDAAAGNQVGIWYFRDTNELVFGNNTSFADASEVRITYNSTTHRWWRLRHSGTTVFWETAPDGITWTTRRSLNPAPTWLHHSQYVLFESARDTGTNNVAVFDNVNQGTPQTITTAGAIATGEAVGSHTVTLASQTITGVGNISTGEAFGTAVVTTGAVSLAPGGITSAEAFGSPTVTTGAVTLAPGGIASGEAFGTALITLAVTPTGIATAEAFGTAAVTTGPVTLSPTGISSAEAIGTAVVTVGAVNLAPTGITSAEAFGTATVTTGAVTVAPTGIGTGEQFGTATVVPGAVTLAPTGITSAEAVGTPTVTTLTTLTPTGIGSAEQFGTAAVTTGPVDVAPTGIGTDEAFGTPTVATGALTLAPGGIASAEQFGTATLTTGPVTVAPTGIGSDEAFGTPNLGTVLAPVAIGSDEAFGTPALTTGPVTLTPGGIGSGEAFGTAVVSNGAVLVAPAGIASQEAHGTPVVTVGGVAVDPLGIGSAEALGTPTVTTGPADINPSGIGTGEQFGTPTLIQAGPQTITVGGIASDEAFGTPAIANAATQFIFVTGIASGEDFDPSTVAGFDPPYVLVNPALSIPSGSFGRAVVALAR